jgi:5'-3' exonuclease
MSGPLLAIDGPFVMYRSFFALPDSITDADGHPTNALLGAVNLILRIAADARPRAIVVCWGAEAAVYRKELYPDYHATRPPVPDALQWQFDRAPELFAALGWESLGSDELEADDLLGSYAHAEVDADGSAEIVTGDRDLFQCAADDVTVLYVRTGVKGYEEVDPAEVQRRYGVPPESVPDFIALRGDPSDGLPGAKGVGEKTAAELLRTHGSLEAALDAWSRVRPARVAGALRDQRDEVLMFKDIATLRRKRVERPADAPTDFRGGARAARSAGMERLATRLDELDG